MFLAESAQVGCFLGRVGLTRRMSWCRSAFLFCFGALYNHGEVWDGPCGRQKGKEVESMAVEATPVDSTLQIVLDMGVDENNKPILKTSSYRRVKTEALDQDLVDVANQLAGLQSHDVHAYRKVVETELTEIEG